MKSRKFLCLLLVCALVLGCGVLTGAADVSDSDPVYCYDLPRSSVAFTGHVTTQNVTRASGSFGAPIPANSGVTVDDSFYLRENATVTFNCTYTPKSASVDFGVIAPDGYFYSLNSTTGSINKAIRVNQSGSYTIAIQNNSSYTVNVTGRVSY